MGESMDFGDAVRAMKAGQEVRRRNWRRDWKVAIMNGVIVTFISGPIGWMSWKPEFDDILAEDWELSQ